MHNEILPTPDHLLDHCSNHHSLNRTATTAPCTYTTTKSCNASWQGRTLWLLLVHHMNSLLYHYANHLNASSTHCPTEVFPLSGICSCLVISVIRELTVGLHRKVTDRTVVHTLNGLAGTAVIGQPSGLPCFFSFFLFFSLHSV